jgi:hypothetical protein
MKHRPLFLFFVVLLGIAAGCYTGPSTDTKGPPIPSPTSASSSHGTEPAPRLSGGLPCDVADLLKAFCVDCHGDPPTGGAKDRLITYEDLQKPSESDPSTTLAQRGLVRMKSADRPMPPDGTLPPALVRVFEKWVTAGLPRTECRTSTDAGVIDAAASVCTSGMFASADALPSAVMKPGEKCITCHADDGGPTLEAAGTVYETLHEPDDCHGIGDLEVLIVDADGKTEVLTTNAAGNFLRWTSFPKPYRAMVVRGTRVREMQTAQTDTDCNGCHTESGAGAPGRIQAP